MSNVEASVIIRVKNERANLAKVLERLGHQTSQSFEIVIVDDNSTDGSEAVAFEKFPESRVKLVRVAPGAYTYPAASNLGAEAASGRYLVYLSAHSFPVTDTWLRDGLTNFTDPRVAGVFAYPLALPSANGLERALYGVCVAALHAERKIYRKPVLGILGATNAAIPRDFWQECPFDERYERGGEDTHWAAQWMERGYVVVQDPRFRVYHSHDLSLRGLVKQYMGWRRMRRPSRMHPRA